MVQSKQHLATLKADVMASLVVFLVALPLCLGIAIASGAPPVAGIISGIIGGLVVAALGGNPMQVSGPANGMIVVVLLVTQQYGLAILGVVVLAAGALQVAAGSLRLGRAFRAIPPATVHGLMTGFAIIIFASQFHVMLDDPLRGSTISNLLCIPQAVWDAITDRSGSHRAAALGVLTVIALLTWKRIAPTRLAFLPPSLVAVALAASVATAWSLPVARIDLPDKLLDAVHWLDLASLPRLLEWPVFQFALIIAFLASTETLLSATALERLHHGARTNYDRELVAQGIGNMLCGALGGVPLTGVIIRSAANVAAGAQTRLSSVLHGLWLLVMVAFAQDLLRLIPTASLAAVLVVAVFKLFDLRAVRQMWLHDRSEFFIYLSTAAGIVAWGVLPGVFLGLGLALIKLLYALGRLELRIEHQRDRSKAVLHLAGRATLLSAPKLARALESLPVNTELHVRCHDLHLIDHACLELLLNWDHRNRPRGGRLVLDWSEMHSRYAASGISPRLASADPPAPARPWRGGKQTPSGWQLVWSGRGES